MNNIAFKIKLMMAQTTWSKKALIFGVLRLKPPDKAIIHFIGGARDTRPNGRFDPGAIRPEPFHGSDCLICDTGKCAFPPGMRSADNTCPTIDQQNRRTISRQDAEQQPGAVCNHGIGVRARLQRNGLCHQHDLCTVNLKHRGKICAGEHDISRAPTIFKHGRCIILRAHAHIETGMNAGGNTAAPSKKTVRDTLKRLRGYAIDCVHPRCLAEGGGYRPVPPRQSHGTKERTHFGRMRQSAMGFGQIMATLRMRAGQRRSPFRNAQLA